MNILDARVEWRHRFTNTPDFYLLLDEWPRDEFRYLKRGPLYYAEHGGAVQFKFYERPGNGYGGSVYHLPMLDGSTAELKGPWSSSPSAMNAACMFRHYARATGIVGSPCADIRYTTDPKVWERGYTFYGGAAATIPLLLQAAEMTNTHLVFVTQDRVSSDLSYEQNQVVGHPNGYRTGRWETYLKAPEGTAFTFCPSVQADRLAKAEPPAKDGE